MFYSGFANTIQGLNWLWRFGFHYVFSRYLWGRVWHSLKNGHVPGRNSWEDEGEGKKLQAFTETFPFCVCGLAPQPRHSVWLVVSQWAGFLATVNMRQHIVSYNIAKGQMQCCKLVLTLGLFLPSSFISVCKKEKILRCLIASASDNLKSHEKKRFTII